MSNKEEFDLRWILFAVFRWWWLILVCSLLAGGAAYWVMTSKEPIYEVATTLAVSPGQESKSSEYNTLIAGERLALTYIEMLKSRTILDQVKSQLGLQESTDDLANRIQASTVKDTQLIRIMVRDTSPTRAALIANTIAETFTTYIQNMQADRYASSLTSLEEEMKTLLAASEETKVKINTLNASKIKNESGLADLETLLSDQRDYYRSLEQDYEDLKLTVSTSTDVIKVVESARAGNTGYPYQATTSLLIEPEELIETYSQLLVGRTVLEAVIARLGLDEDPETLQVKVSVKPVKDTNLIHLSVVDSDIVKAALIANTIAEIFISNVKEMLEEPYVSRLEDLQVRLDDTSAQIEDTQAKIAALTTKNGDVETELSFNQTLLVEQRNDYRTLKESYGQTSLAAANATEVISIVELAQAPKRYANSNDLLYIVLAVLVGALLASGFAFLAEYMNETIRTPIDIEGQLGLKGLGTINRLMRREKNNPVISEQHLSSDADAFRVLAANLRYSCLEHPLHTLLITSPNPREGKSIVSSNLATVMALMGQRVILVDADLRRPNIHLIFDFKRSEGLTNSLLDKTLNGRLQQAGPAGLKVLTSGDPSPAPAELLGSSFMRDLLLELQQQADIVIIDCPPILPVFDTTLLAPHVDGILLVVRANQTHRSAAFEAVESLRKVGASVVGAVLNDAPRSKKGYSYYYSNPDNGDIQRRLKRGMLAIMNHMRDKIGKKG